MGSNLAISKILFEIVAAGTENGVDRTDLLAIIETKSGKAASNNPDVLSSPQQVSFRSKN